MMSKRASGDIRNPPRRNSPDRLRKRTLSRGDRVPPRLPPVLSVLSYSKIVYRFLGQIRIELPGRGVGTSHKDRVRDPPDKQTSTYETPCRPTRVLRCRVVSSKMLSGYLPERNIVARGRIARVTRYSRSDVNKGLPHRVHSLCEKSPSGLKIDECEGSRGVRHAVSISRGRRVHP